MSKQDGKYEWMLLFSKENDTSRYSFDKLFVIGDYIYATDGRIMIRSKFDGSVISNLGKGPSADKLDGWLYSENPQDYLSLRRSEKMCEECIGRGYTANECPICDGECCGKADEIKCNYCGCTGKVRWNHQVDFGKRMFAGKYINLIDINCKDVVWYEDSGDGPIHFSFKGGEGLLMTLSKEK